MSLPPEAADPAPAPPTTPTDGRRGARRPFDRLEVAVPRWIYDACIIATLVIVVLVAIQVHVL